MMAAETLCRQKYGVGHEMRDECPMETAHRRDRALREGDLAV
jgi:hypothetical protein